MLELQCCFQLALMAATALSGSGTVVQAQRQLVALLKGAQLKNFSELALRPPDRRVLVDQDAGR